MSQIATVDNTVAGMKAYEINDYEWVAAPADWTREQIIAWHIEETGMTEEEADYYVPFKELSPDATLLTDDTEDGSEAKTTVGAELSGYVERNGVEPYLLACTEY